MKMKNTIFTIIALLLITSLVMTGCKKTEVPETPSQEGAEETDKDMSELDNLDKDLNSDELEGIEKDLEGIDW
jgi:ABC-type oligopeptide transport system substrate-binding subunit